jgi:gag-polyprotein putative aspartyl protease
MTFLKKFVHMTERSRMFRVAAVSVLLLGFSPVRADDVQTVLTKYVSWRGGTAFQAMRSFHEHGEVTAGGVHGKYEQWLLSDGRVRRNDSLGPMSSEQATTTAAGWHTNTSGQIEDLGDDAERARRGVFLAFGSVAENHDAHYSLLNTEERDGKVWDVVRVEFGGPDTYDLLIAPATGELLGERITEDRKIRFVRYSDWRSVTGVRMPFAQEQTGSNAADDLSQHAKSIQINVQTTQALFSRPAETKIWSFASGQTSTGWIDFEYFGDNQIFVPASVNGHPVSLLLDSGAGITVIDSGYAAQLKLKPSGTLGVTGMVGQSTMQLTSNLHIKLGSLSLAHITAGIIDLSGVAAQEAHPMPLVLGKEAFNQLIIDIDFQHRKIAFYDPSGYSGPHDATRVALGHHGDARTVPISLEGAPAAPFDFDLGNAGTLIVYPYYRDRTRLLDGRPQTLDMLGGVGGMVNEKLATLKTIGIAGTQMIDVPAAFPDAGDNAVNSDQTAGNVGLYVLSRFRLITDYPHDALWLTPDPKAVAESFTRNRAGLDFTPAPDRLAVMLVRPGSPAEHSGWKEGAEIIAIDGHKIDAKFSGSALSHWSEQPAGTVVTLTLADGATRQLILADYY